MKRHEIWTQEYRRRRYLEYLNDEELDRRAQDVFSNLLVLSEMNQISMSPFEESGSWLRLFTHTHEEYTLRSRAFQPGLWKDFGIPDPRSPLASKAAEAAKKYKLKNKPYLVKYGKCQYLEDAFIHGNIRVRPASSYSDPSLNKAIRDDELHLSIIAHPGDIKLEVIDRKSGKTKGVIDPIGNVSMSTRSETDYYVYCLSNRLSPRLFLDFEADACLLVMEPKRFLDSLNSKFQGRFQEWDGVAQPVQYLDPHNTTVNDLGPFFGKHFRYSYQKEYRLVWLPPGPQSDLKAVDLELGSLEEYCELIRLDET